MYAHEEFEAIGNNRRREAGSPERQTLLIDDSKLQSLKARPPLNRYLAQLWDRRHFIRADARSKSLQSGRGLFLGKAWLILQPLLDVSFYILVFGVILKIDRGIENYLGFLIIGSIYFSFFNKGLLGGSALIQNSKGFIGAFAFPIASIPIAKVLRQFIDNVIPAVIALLLAFALQFPDSPPSATVFLVPLLYILLHLFILGITFVVARITAFLPDTKALVTLLGRGMFFISGIFFSLERFVMHPFLQSVMELNPVYQFLTAFRDASIYSTAPTLSTWLYLIAWSIGTLLLGFIYFWQAEERYPSVR